MTIMAYRDTQWLMIEACREFQRGTCKRSDAECKYAHPGSSVTVENGRVTACFDSLKGRCTRENCKYLHPPPHLKTQLEINGRNTLATQKMLQNLQNQQLQQVVGMTNMANLQVQHSPTAALLQGGQGMPAGPGSNQIVIPTSSPYMGKDASTTAANAAASAAAATLYYQHAPSQMYNGLTQIMTQSPYSLPANGQAQPQLHSSQGPTDTNNMYSPFYLPVAVSMAPTMSAGTHTNAGPYGSYFMPFPGSSLGGLTPSQASSMGLVPDLQGLQTQMIPAGGQGLPMMHSMKTKNDKLELPTTPESQSLKRQRDPADDALLNLSGLAPPPLKKSVSAGGYGGQGTGPMMNFFSHPQFPYHPQLGPAMLQSHQPTPVVPTPFPVMPSMAPGGHGQSIPLFAPIMPTQQSNETIPVCRDFKSGSCKRPTCKYAHVTEDYVEIIDGKVTLCRYAVQNRCTRQRCKFYHPPPASALAAMVSPGVQLPTLPATGISSI